MVSPEKESAVVMVVVYSGIDACLIAGDCVDIVIAVVMSPEKKAAMVRAGIVIDTSLRRLHLRIEVAIV